jgi:hypothetical protein
MVTNFKWMEDKRWMEWGQLLNEMGTNVRRNDDGCRTKPTATMSNYDGNYIVIGVVE